ncbi:GerMN domain-containing protein [Lacticigenium naphthae]|uniref:GerMN domain-containing protein n=1 Tax=Lacticigenium naphthae TaxID=515351 RepID=UPI0003FA3CD1|nr:GerMN domain-containing protein [Lacticigenium naphthae]
MKKIPHLLIFSGSVLLLGGCSLFADDEPIDTSMDTSDTTDSMDTTESTDTTEETDDRISILDYFPVAENTLHRYEGTGNEYASFTHFPQYIEGEYIQYTENNGGTEMVTVLHLTEEKAEEVFRRAEVYYRQNFIAEDPETLDSESLEIRLQAPIEVGTSWESPSGSQSEITALEVTVDTPSGSYEALEVTTQQDESISRFYYAPDVGLVQAEHNVEMDEENRIYSRLEVIEEDAAETYTIPLYYLDEQALGLEEEMMEFEMSTNESFRETATDLLQSPLGPNDFKMISDNTTINTLYLNEDGYVYVDLSEDFIADMNAGAGIESMILQGLANSLGKYYSAERVYLTIDGGAYESGHIVLEEDDYLTVDDSMVNE